jgi:hypothetical protein
MSLFKRNDGSPRKKRVLGVIVAGLVTLAGAGTAFAYWTEGGSGTGNATTTAPSSVTVVQTTSVTNMYPGDTVALAGDFNNPNPGKVYVTSVTATIGTFSAQANSALPACTQGDFTITGTSTIPGEIASGTAVGAWSGLSITLTDAATNQDNCESLTTVPVVYTAS